MKYPYILNQASLKAVIGKIKTTGTPTKFDLLHLKTLGYKSSNDRPIIPILKFIGFLDSSGSPTERYKQYRGRDGTAILGSAIQETYADLFTVHVDAHRKDDESLNNFFATRTTGGQRVLKAMVATFKTLCSIASFDGNPVEIMPPAVDTISPPKGGLPSPQDHPENTFSININIELQIPATNDPEVYKNFFKALRENLLDEKSK